MLPRRDTCGRRRLTNRPSTPASTRLGFSFFGLGPDWARNGPGVGPGLGHWPTRGWSVVAEAMPVALAPAAPQAASVIGLDRPDKGIGRAVRLDLDRTWAGLGVGQWPR